MALLIVKLVIWSICVFIVGTLFVVMVRRLYMQRRYLVLDAERVRCAHVFDAVAGGEMPDRSVHLRPPGSPGWIAMEETLFKALDAGADRALVLKWFDDLGYVDRYIIAYNTKNRWDRVRQKARLSGATPVLTAAFGAGWDTRNMAVFARSEDTDTRCRTYRRPEDSVERRRYIDKDSQVVHNGIWR